MTGIKTPEPEAWLIEWQVAGVTWVEASANEYRAVDQARKHGGSCTPMVRANLIEAQARRIKDAEAWMRRALIYLNYCVGEDEISFEDLKEDVAELVTDGCAILGIAPDDIPAPSFPFLS